MGSPEVRIQFGEQVSSTMLFDARPPQRFAHDRAHAEMSWLREGGRLLYTRCLEPEGYRHA
jgi:hypothetical protein